jgi:mannobiose 2-epimerase
MVYALSEFAMASGHPEAMDYAVRTYETLETLAADNAWGGFAEFLEEDWTPRPEGKQGGGRKSLDVHMHLMEAFTNLYEATGAGIYRRRTAELIALITRRMLHPDHGTGIAQFTPDWTPLRQILFDDVWGADRETGDPQGRPLDNTSYGHNVELAWLMRHAARICGLDEGPLRPLWLRLYGHAAAYGVDRDKGGLFCEGPHAGPARERNKEFWQQAEAMTAFLDAYAWTEDTRYLEAYRNIHRFVFNHVIDHEIGEWRPLFSHDNVPLAENLGTAWKIGYHTVRAMIECERRLSRLNSQLSAENRY